METLRLPEGDHNEDPTDTEAVNYRHLSEMSAMYGHFLSTYCDKGKISLNVF